MTTPSDTKEFGQSQSDSTEGGAHLLAAILWRKWLILALVLIGLGAGYLFYLQQPKIYQSSAQILVLNSQPPLALDGVQQVLAYDKTHQILLKSPVIVNRAVQDSNLAELPSLSGVANPTAAIIAGLTVENVATEGATSSSVIDITYQGTNSGDCGKIVSAIIAAHQQFLADSYQDLNLEAVNLITEAKDELNQDITERKQAYREFQAESPVVILDDGTTAYAERLARIEDTRAKIMLQKAETQAQLDGIEAALARGGDREAINLMVGHVTDGQQATGNPVEDLLFPLMLEEQLLLESYGEDHYKIKSIRKRIAMTREHATGQSVGDDGEPRDFFAVYLDSLREGVKISDQTLSELDELYNDERNEAKKAANLLAQDEAFREEIMRKEQLFQAVMARLDTVKLTKDEGATTTQVISEPSPGAKVSPNLAKILLVVGMFGLVSGMGLALVFEMADRRFRSPDDIHDQLGLRVLSHVPAFSPAALRASSNGHALGDGRPLIALEQPHSQAAEAYRAVRTAMMIAARTGGQRVFQVTSPHAGDGKTTLCGNLAILLAQTGQRVLVVDADFRRPQCAAAFGLSNAVGLSDVMAGQAEIPDAIQAASVENLFVMTSGTPPRNPAELLSGPRFDDLIETLREQYDVVLIDTPPLLAVTDPSIVAPRVDGVLLVMQLSKRTRQAATRACEILASLGARMLGTVVNRVGRGSDYPHGYGSLRHAYHYETVYAQASERNGRDYAPADEELDDEQRRLPAR